MVDTSDLCDQHFPEIQVATPGLKRFGAPSAFSGEVATLRVFEDSGLVKTVIAEPGNSRVLVIDGGGSVQRALTGGMMAAKAMENGWAGLVYNGCIRDAAELASLDIGVLALGACPVRPAQDGKGERDIEVSFLGVRFRPGDRLYADADGLVVLPAEA